MNRDQVKGAVKNATGKVQRQVGKVIDSPEQQVKGLEKEVEGKIQQTYGNAKEAAKKRDH